jgi:U3 small nucleolar RNA-associated protein MPP10
VSASLDALSSWHYRPRPVEPSIAIVTDVPVVAMEDAQPTTAQGIAGGESRVAPQEVYRPGEDGTVGKGEVVEKGGAPIAKGEMSREEKAARRRREKERRRKSGVVDGVGSNGNGNGNVVGAQRQGKKAKEQKETLAQLQKGGVRVINRKGEVVDLAGKKAKAPAMASGGSYKL